jgi:hypothetical protein
MKTYDVAIVGGGAAGLAAAITAGRSNLSVVILEKQSRIGRKVLASGSGRCNLLNENISPDFYNKPSKDLIESVFSVTDKNIIVNFFKDLGLFTYAESGRIYPRTNQSSSVLKVLQLGVAACGVNVLSGFRTEKITRRDSGFSIEGKGGRKIAAKKVILACGGKSYPSLGADGSGYKLAVSLGHKLIEPVPGNVALKAKSRLVHPLQGQRVKAVIKSFIDGQKIRSVNDDLLFTRYGLSGAGIFNISRELSIAVNRLSNKKASVKVDLVPYLDPADLEKEISKRAEAGLDPEGLISGILPNKFRVLLDDIKDSSDTGLMTEKLKNLQFTINGTLGWDEAQCASGGISTAEVKKDTLESKRVKGLYLAGEMMDVDGICGGYNLAWAWASGITAGRLK